MNLIRILKLLAKNLALIIIFPLAVGILVYFFNRTKPKEYQSGMIVNTGIASGANLASLNSNRVDYFAVNNSFDNLTTTIQSRETLEELAFSLLARHLSANDEYEKFISTDLKAKLKTELRPELYDELIKLKDKEKIKKRIKELYFDTEINDIKEIIQKRSGHYNIDEIRGALTISRKASSDMLEIIFKSIDPGVCYQTLDLLAIIFIEKYSSMRNNEAGGIIDYFIEEIEKAKSKLNLAEENLKNYSQKNQIINYTEQTKFIAEAKEELERDIYRTKMEIESSESALNEVNKKLDAQSRRYLNSEEILETRKQLSKLNTEITSLSLRGQSDNRQKMDSLMQIQENLRIKIGQDAKNFYSTNYSPEVLPRLTILGEFLKLTLDLDMGKAKINVLENHRSYFDRLFDEFAPIGFNLSKMEREIQIAEQEYLSILHGLNQAKLQKSNSELFGSFELLDRPFFPINPKSSKTLLLVVGGSFVSLFFLLAVIIGKELLNRSIRSPKLIQSSTGLNLIGAYPHLIKNKKINQAKLLDKLQNLLINNLAIALKGITEPPLIFIISTRSKGEISSTGLFVAESLQKIQEKLIFYYYLDEHNSIHHIDQSHYDRRLILKEYDPLNKQLIEEINKQRSQNTGIVVQVPEFENSILYKFSQLSPSCIILVVHADEAWGFHDKSTLNLIEQIFSGVPIHAFGAKMDPEFMEEIISEIPKDRTKVRIWLKSLITLK